MESDSIVVIVVSLIFSAFFSGVEIAYISANKLKIEVEKNKGNKIAGFLAHIIQKPSRFITTMLLGNNIALVIFGLAMAGILEPIFPVI